MTGGQNRRLIINVPPRSLKSILVSVIYVAFLMGNDPSLKIIVSSHNQELARKLASDFRRLTASALFRRLFPRFELADDGDRVMEQKTTHNGHRIATSVGATITGHGADVIIVDDPNRAKDIYSEAHRRRVKTYFDQELSSRLNDKQRGKIIVVMQRLHEDDLTGHLLSRGAGWTHVRIQAMAEEMSSYRTGYGLDDVFCRPVGDILLPQVNNFETLEDVRAMTGSINFQAQYQQNPSPADGVVIKRDWLRYCDKLPEEFDFLVVSWDTASTIEEGSDYSAGTIWGLRNQHFYLIDVLRGRYEAPDLRRVIEDTHLRYGAHQTLIERAGIGHAIGAEMRKQSRIKPLLLSVTTDKTARLLAQSPKFEASQVIFPREAPWLGLYLHELLAFPNVLHDDQVDSTSQALKYLTTKLAPPIRADRPANILRGRPRSRMGK
jgi:predicted phage terminase large subunit-like protein